MLRLDSIERIGLRTALNRLDCRVGLHWTDLDCGLCWTNWTALDKLDCVGQSLIKLGVTSTEYDTIKLDGQNLIVGLHWTKPDNCILFSTQ